MVCAYNTLCNAPGTSNYAGPWHASSQIAMGSGGTAVPPSFIGHRPKTMTLDTGGHQEVVSSFVLGLALALCVMLALYYIMALIVFEVIIGVW